jgi:sulfoxide reductase heme-binding subunit YedZ
MQITTLATATGPHVFWLASRAAGIAALILSSVSVCVGLLMGTRLRAGRGAELRVAHEALSLATLAAIAVHGLTLLGDGFLRPSLADISVPFAGSYMTLWTTAGIVSFWALALLGLSYYLRGRIGVQRWRRLHRLAALAWALGLAHSLGEGTDAGQSWFLAMVAITTVPALLALAAIWARRWTATGANDDAGRPAARGGGGRPATEQPYAMTGQR